MSTEPILSEEDYELLSAYIDRELSNTERAGLESRLQTEAGLRRELSALRQTIALVNQLPTLKAPRDFRLDPAKVQPILRVEPKAPRRRAIPLTLVATAAAVFMVVVGFSILTLTGPAVGNIFSNVVMALEPGGNTGSGMVAAAPTMMNTATSENITEGAAPAASDALATEAQVIPQATPAPQTLTDESAEAEDLFAATLGTDLLKATTLAYSVQATDLAPAPAMEISPSDAAADTATSGVGGSGQTEMALESAATESPPMTAAAVAAQSSASSAPLTATALVNAPVAPMPTNTGMLRLAETPTATMTLPATDTPVPTSSPTPAAVAVTDGAARDRQETQTVSQSLSLTVILALALIGGGLLLFAGMVLVALARRIQKRDR